mmetsp:Transcript_5973/g.17084  ORF Transcript_5973/g.17084 Transcript_5973/m.17084 type:complete len:233 (-) Transcript_5973:1327-2025(-)
MRRPTRAAVMGPAVQCGMRVRYTIQSSARSRLHHGWWRRRIPVLCQEEDGILRRWWTRRLRQLLCAQRRPLPLCWPGFRPPPPLRPRRPPLVVRHTRSHPSQQPRVLESVRLSESEVIQPNVTQLVPPIAMETVWSAGQEWSRTHTSGQPLNHSRRSVKEVRHSPHHHRQTRSRRKLQRSQRARQPQITFTRIVARRQGQRKPPVRVQWGTHVGQPNVRSCGTAGAALLCIS